LLLLFGFWAVLFLGVITMPGNFGPLAWAIAGMVLLVLVAFLFGLGIRLMRWLQLLKPAPERLQALVREMSQKMGVPVRATWVLPTHLSNAVALPLTGQLIFTEKLLSTHPDAEIKAICAHELGHLNEPRKVIFVRALVALALFPLVFINPMNSLTGVANGFLLILIPVLILFLVGMRVSRRMEKRADKIAIESEHINPEVYARALERLYQTNQMPAVMPRRSNKIHPDLYDRMLAAGVTPDFPKPAPAKGLSWPSCLVLASLFVLPVLAVFIKAFWGVWQIGVNP
jgi:Zn-dependent protease with chaperone function